MGERPCESGHHGRHDCGAARVRDGSFGRGRRRARGQRVRRAGRASGAPAARRRANPTRVWGPRPRRSPPPVGVPTRSIFAATATATGPRTASTASDAFAADVEAVATGLDARPASLAPRSAGCRRSSRSARARAPIASALVLVDVAPPVEREGAKKIGSFMRGGCAASTRSRTPPTRSRPSCRTGPGRRTCRACRRTCDDAATAAGTGTGTRRLIGIPEGIDGQDGLVDHDRLRGRAPRMSPCRRCSSADG